MIELLEVYYLHRKGDSIDDNYVTKQWHNVTQILLNENVRYPGRCILHIEYLDSINNMYYQTCNEEIDFNFKDFKYEICLAFNFFDCNTKIIFPSDVRDHYWKYPYEDEELKEYMKNILLINDIFDSMKEDIDDMNVVYIQQYVELAKKLKK